MKDCELSFAPPPNSPADIATKSFQHKFPVQSNLTNLVILATTTNHSDIREYGDLSIFSQRLNASLFDKHSSTIFDFQSYFSLVDLGLPVELADQFLSRNENGTTAKHPDSTIFILVVRGEETSKGLITFSEDVRTLMSQIGVVDGVELTLTGLPALYDGIMASAIHDLETMDSMVLPMAMLILGLLVWSFRLLVVPLAALGVSAALSFSTVDGLTKLGIPILTAAPSLMASVFIAMSIDYSMFLLTRFQEEKLVLAQYTASGKMFFSSQKQKKEVEDPEQEEEEEEEDEEERKDFSVQLIPIMAIVLRSSGKIIVASGTTLVICFAGLLALPLNLMQSIGLSCAVSLVYTMIVNLTLCPALIFSFPIFFTNSCLPQWWSTAQSSSSSSSSSTTSHQDTHSSPFSSHPGAAVGMGSVLDNNDLASSGGYGYGARAEKSNPSERSSDGGGTPADHLVSRARSSSSVLSVDLDEHQRAFLRKTCWYKIAKFTQSYFGSCFVLLLTCAAVIPLGVRDIMKKNLNFFLFSIF